MTGAYLQFTNEIKKNEVDTILELGSRDGKDAILLRDHFDAEVISFECNPKQADVCGFRLRNEDNILFSDLAVWDHTGTIPFYPVVNGNSGASSAFKADPAYPYETYHQSNVEVPCTRLDEFCARHEIEPNLICMDLQGSELAALRGMGSMLQSNKLRHIISEVQFTPMYIDAPTHSDLAEFLTPFGFAETLSIGVNTWFGDSLFQKQNWLDDFRNNSSIKRDIER
jgi:FkbM family methyltransferase